MSVNQFDWSKSIIKSDDAISMEIFELIILHREPLQHLGIGI